MSKKQPPDQTPREKRWADAVGEHWHPYEATPETQERADEEVRSRSLKPTHIESHPPHDDGDPE